MNLRKYLKVYKKFLHTSLASELEYKTNILIDLITAILSLIGSIFLLSIFFQNNGYIGGWKFCLLYTSPSPRDVEESRMPSSA